MSFKFFLGYAPEEMEIFDANVSTEFRRKRLKDIYFGNECIAESIKIASSLGIIKSSVIIVDATHTKSKYCKKTVTDIFKKTSKELVK
jgi:hypothetical protein